MKCIVLMTSLLAALQLLLGATVFAAPPRFSAYGTPSAPAQTTPEQEATAVDPQSTVTTAEAVPEAQPEMKIEFIDGKLVQTPITPEPSTAQTPSQATSTQSTSSANTPVAMSAPAEMEQPQKRRPLITFGKRKPIIPDEKTQKQNEELVTTYEYHESDIQTLRMSDKHRYVPGFEEFWKVNSSKVMCSMKQDIPGYGHVEFRQGVGQPLEFALYVTYPPAGIGRAHIRIEPPEWRHYSREKDLGVIEIEPGDLAVSTSPDWANRLLLELREGMQPVMRYWDAADGTDDMEVLISSLNFQESLDLFNRCLGQILRYDFDSVKRTIVHFHEDSSKLRTKATSQLDEVMEILNEDKKVEQIDLELYTHSEGLVRYNFRLATRRARAVRDYFMQRGVPEDKIIIKIHTHKKAKLDEMGYKATDVHIVLRRKAAK